MAGATYLFGLFGEAAKKRGDWIDLAAHPRHGPHRSPDERRGVTPIIFLSRKSRTFDGFSVLGRNGPPPEM